MADQIEGCLEIFSCSQIEDGHSTNLLLGVIGQLAEQLVAVNEGPTQIQDGHSNTTRVENILVLGCVNLVGVLRWISGTLISSGSRPSLVKGGHGRFGWNVPKVSKRPNPVLRSHVTNSLSRLGPMCAIADHLHLLNQLVAIPKK